VKQRLDKEEEALVDDGPRASDEQKSEEAPAGADKPVRKPKARAARKSKAAEPELVVPAELQQNPELQGASRPWLKLYSAIHKEARR